MAKKFVYTDTKTHQIIFESIEPNYASIDDVDKKVLKETGKDPRILPHIERMIRVVQ